MRFVQGVLTEWPESHQSATFFSNGELHNIGSWFRLGGQLYALPWRQSVFAFELHFSTSLSMISSAHPQIMIILAGHHSRQLGDSITCRDRRQYMDYQLTRRYVVYKDHGKQMAQRILYQAIRGSLAFRQGLVRSVDTRVVDVGIRETRCRRSRIYLQRHSSQHGRIHERHTQHGRCDYEIIISMRSRQNICSFRHGFGRFYKEHRGPKLSRTSSTLLCSRYTKREILDGSAIVLENGQIRFFP